MHGKQDLGGDITFYCARNNVFMLTVIKPDEGNE